MTKKPKILIVDDEMLFAVLLQTSLALLGYEVCKPTATSTEAIEAAQREQPDIVLMDVRLAGGNDGIEVARQIQSLCEAQIVFVSGYADGDMRHRAEQIHPLAYLIKPVTAVDILPILRDAETSTAPSPNNEPLHLQDPKD